MTISSVEHVLTVHVRTALSKSVSKPHLKLISFGISLLSCLFVGAILTVSIFTPYFTNDLGYNQFQINLIGSFISMGMYLPLPILGYLADYHGPVVLSVLSLVMLSPGYVVVGSAYDHRYPFEYMLLGFALIGCGTSALYFTCLLTCAKIYPHFKSLSISGPITCYGLSSFIISKIVLGCSYFHKNTQDAANLDVGLIFRSFGILFIVLSFANWIASSIVTIEKDVLFDQVHTDDPEAASAATETSPLTRTISHHTKFQTFLHDKSMYLLLLSMLLCVGPLESFIVNISSFSDVLDLENSSELIKFSFCSTFARLLFGIVLELVPGKLSTKIFLILGVLAVQFAGSVMTYHDNWFSVGISSMFGIAYGGIFTIYPTMLASIWGVDIFGSTWGLFMLAPAFGSILFGLVYGAEYDSHCINSGLGNSSDSRGINCLYNSFSTISGGLIAASLLIIFNWHSFWKPRNI